MRDAGRHRRVPHEYLGPLHVGITDSPRALDDGE